MLTQPSSWLAAGLIITSLTWAQQGDPQLAGTWTTKSRKVVTGPGFYDPVNEKMFEPKLTGFSYSFTADGHYEESYYRAISNPGEPNCPKGLIQWQHGTYTKNANGSLSLTPFGVDGRQLMSDPCNFGNAIYTRYHQFELFKEYAVSQDKYSGAQRLDLYAFDGSPLNPMYLAYKPPQMLPTMTLNPTADATGSGATKSTGKVKRGLDDLDLGIHPDALNREVLRKAREGPDADRWWWVGVGLTAAGAFGYYCF
ncbi:Reversal of tor2 lethality [Puttea exsequens]|nr:Reversal of tor2 lethality [Puttea exsequens]